MSGRRSARRLRVQGVVQGVGFRPRVHALATSLGLDGWVRNDGRGVTIELEGPAAALEELQRALRESPPPAARIESLEAEEIAPAGRRGFAILASEAAVVSDLPVSPELATCADCRRELFDPSDRRHRYPFLNCTNCGPRFTIVRDVPYDRPRTTMAAFPPCEDCAREYEHPADRRFHAQPVACPACGPQLSLEAEGRVLAARDEALREARDRLARGEVLAIKGLGGYHLACDAGSAEAVGRLRSRKERDEKPFALMAADLAAIEPHALVSELEASLLAGPDAPIVLLERRPESDLPEAIAPGRDRLGVMLPYTPLHLLLLERAEGFPELLVMTSGNRSDEPIAYRDEDARRRLGRLSDAILLHDREIHVRADDSVLAELRGAPALLRRSRGHAPLPLSLPFEAPPLLAGGGELKNVFCLAKGRRSFPSQHLGDLDHHENLLAFEEGLGHLERLLRIEPELFAADLHPDYRATRLLKERSEREGRPLELVQHHHAHAASVMAEHGLGEDEEAIAACFDGTGYGADGTIWGGEILVAGYRDFRRAAQLAPCPLPGGDAAVRSPWRTALAWLRRAGVDWSEDLPPVAAASEQERAVLARQLETGLNCPTTTSAGRLFDAVAALLGVRQRVSYEAQGPCELEALADRRETGALSFALEDGVIHWAPALRELVAARRAGTGVAALSARFHRGLAEAVVAACLRLRDEGAPGRVVLSGGAWQNRLLVTHAAEGLEREGFRVLLPVQLPANDGGLSHGQAAVAAARAAG